MRALSRRRLHLGWGLVGPNSCPPSAHSAGSRERHFVTRPNYMGNITSCYQSCGLFRLFNKKPRWRGSTRSHCSVSGWVSSQRYPYGLRESSSTVGPVLTGFIQFISDPSSSYSSSRNPTTDVLYLEYIPSRWVRTGREGETSLEVSSGGKATGRVLS